MVISGGLGISGAVFADSTFDINGHATLDRVSIDTTDGVFSITGTNAITASVGAASSISTTAGNLSLSSDAAVLDLDGQTGITANSAAGGITLGANGTSSFTVTGAFDLTHSSTAGSVIMSSGEAQPDAIKIQASNAAGGVTVLGGTAGLQATMTDGPILLDAQGAESHFLLASTGAAQDLNIGVTGAFNSSLILSSTGTGADALRLDATNVAGGIVMTGGTSGLNVDMTNGPITLDAQGVASHFLLASTGAAQDLNIGVTGAFDSSLILSSTGTGADALRLDATNVAGGIVMTGGTSGLNVDMTNGPITLDAQGVASHFLLASTGAAQDLTFGVTGAFDSSLILSSTGTGADAIKINATAGGIDANATGEINIDTTDTVNGIKIAQTTNIPVSIGGTNSTVTIGNDMVISGDLTVSGTTTTVDSIIVTIDDNILVINNGPVSAGTDGGIIIKRYQNQNDAGTGDVVSDTPTYSGTAQSGTSTTIVLAVADLKPNNFYNGWWIKITGGTGANQVRRIKSYLNSTNTATIYDTADETGNPQTPATGADFTTPPDNTSTYNLYDCPYVGQFYIESEDRIVLGHSNLDPSANVNITKFANFAANDADFSGTINVDTINEYTLNNGVDIETVHFEDGAITNVVSINGTTADTVATVNLLDNSTVTYATVPGTATSGAYLVLVKPTSNPNGAHAVFTIAGNVASGGFVSRTASVSSSTGERLDMDWVAGESPKIRHGKEKTGGTGVNINYTIKVTAI